MRCATCAKFDKERGSYEYEYGCIVTCNDIKVEQLGMAKEFWQNGVQDAVS